MQFFCEKVYINRVHLMSNVRLVGDRYGFGADPAPKCMSNPTTVCITCMWIGFRQSCTHAAENFCAHCWRHRKKRSTAKMSDCEYRADPRRLNCYYLVFTDIWFRKTSICLIHLSFCERLIFIFDNASQFYYFWKYNWHYDFLVIFSVYFTCKTLLVLLHRWVSCDGAERKYWWIERWGLWKADCPWIRGVVWVSIACSLYPSLDHQYFL